MLVVAATGLSLFDWISGGAAVVSAAAAAVAAGASWKSTQQSMQITRDSRDALALAMEPTVWVRTEFTAPPNGLLPYSYFLDVRIHDRWPASDVEVQVRYVDGHLVTQRREFLDLNGGSAGSSANLWQIPLGEGHDVAPGPWDDLPALIRAVVVYYSDQRGLARYEMTIGPDATGGQSGTDTIFDTGHGQVRKTR